MPEPDRIIRLKTVINRSGLSRSTVYRKISEGTFPPQVKVSLCFIPISGQIVLRQPLPKQ
jgi:predicted DNA-binding transcriptional regulator AlpA